MIIKNIKQFDNALLEEMINTGMMRKRISKDGKLMLFNYSKSCIYERSWNEVTLNLRGHIFEIDSGNAVALSFPKFFEYSEMTTETKQRIMKKSIYRVYEKIDGILGIIYNFEDKWRLNTRTQFESIEITKALSILEKLYDLSKINKKYSLLVEIISPELRIVADYGNEEKLVLLSVYDVSSGDELPDDRLEEISKLSSLPLAKKFNYTIEEIIQIKDTFTKDFEGFVIRFEDNERVKIKSTEYLKFMLLLMNITPLGFWRLMKQGKVDKETLIMIPEEHREKAENITRYLENKYRESWEERKREYESLLREIQEETGLTIEDSKFRKEMGLRKRKLKYENSIFLLFNNKIDDLDYVIMQEIRPKDNEMES